MLEFKDKVNRKTGVRGDGAVIRDLAKNSHIKDLEGLKVKSRAKNFSMEISKDKEVKKAIADYFEDNEVVQVLKDGLNAQKNIYGKIGKDEDGKIDTCADHSIRLNAAEKILKLKNAYPKSDDTGDIVSFFINTFHKTEIDARELKKIDE